MFSHLKSYKANKYYPGKKLQQNERYAHLEWKKNLLQETKTNLDFGSCLFHVFPFLKSIVVRTHQRLLSSYDHKVWKERGQQTS